MVVKMMLVVVVMRIVAYTHLLQHVLICRRSIAAVLILKFLGVNVVIVHFA